MVPEPRMLEILAHHPENPEGATRALVSAALQAGGVDNVTVVVVDVREEDPPAERARRGDTQELRTILPEYADAPRPGSSRYGSLWGKKSSASRPKGKGMRQLGRAMVTLVRVAAAGLVLAALLTPFYLWSSSRHFLGFDGGEVVVYRGLPYAPFGLQLSEEVQRTGLEESEVEERFRDDVESHKLYSSEEQAEAVVRDLEAG
jgi:protein phosphatase